MTEISISVSAGQSGGGAGSSQDANLEAVNTALARTFAEAKLAEALATGIPAQALSLELYAQAYALAAPHISIERARRLASIFHFNNKQDGK